MLPRSRQECTPFEFGPVGYQQERDEKVRTGSEPVPRGREAGMLLGC